MTYHRTNLSLPLCALLVAGLSHAGTIQYQVTDVPQQAQSEPPLPPLLRYTYSASGITLLANQELDIVFSAGLYGAISNGVASPAFDVMLFQPNNPPGVPGHFSALALLNVGPEQEIWSVDFVFTGTGRPGSQPYYINQYDAAGRFVGIVDSGSTSDSQGVPEPGTFVLAGLVVAGRGVWWAVRRRSARTAHRG